MRIFADFDFAFRPFIQNIKIRFYNALTYVILEHFIDFIYTVPPYKTYFYHLLISIKYVLITKFKLNLALPVLRTALAGPVYIISCPLLDKLFDDFYEKKNNTIVLCDYIYTEYDKICIYTSYSEYYMSLPRRCVSYN